MRAQLRVFLECIDIHINEEVVQRTRNELQWQSDFFLEQKTHRPTMNIITVRFSHTQYLDTQYLYLKVIPP